MDRFNFKYTVILLMVSFALNIEINCMQMAIQKIAQNAVASTQKSEDLSASQIRSYMLSTTICSAQKSEFIAQLSEQKVIELACSTPELLDQQVVQNRITTLPDAKFNDVMAGVKKKVSARAYQDITKAHQQPLDKNSKKNPIVSKIESKYGQNRIGLQASRAAQGPMTRTPGQFCIPGLSQTASQTIQDSDKASILTSAVGIPYDQIKKIEETCGVSFKALTGMTVDELSIKDNKLIYNDQPFTISHDVKLQYQLLSKLQNTVNPSPEQRNLVLRATKTAANEKQSAPARNPKLSAFKGALIEIAQKTAAGIAIGQEIEKIQSIRPLCDSVASCRECLMAQPTSFTAELKQNKSALAIVGSAISIYFLYKNYGELKRQLDALPLGATDSDYEELGAQFIRVVTDSLSTFFTTKNLVGVKFSSKLDQLKDMPSAGQTEIGSDFYSKKSGILPGVNPTTGTLTLNPAHSLQDQATHTAGLTDGLLNGIAIANAVGNLTRLDTEKASPQQDVEALTHPTGALSGTFTSPLDLVGKLPSAVTVVDQTRTAQGLTIIGTSPSELVEDVVCSDVAPLTVSPATTITEVDTHNASTVKTEPASAKIELRTSEAAKVKPVINKSEVQAKPPVYGILSRENEILAVYGPAYASLSWNRNTWAKQQFKKGQLYNALTQYGIIDKYGREQIIDTHDPKNAAFVREVAWGYNEYTYGEMHPAILSTMIGQEKYAECQKLETLHKTVEAFLHDYEHYEGCQQKYGVIEKCEQIIASKNTAHIKKLIEILNNDAFAPIFLSLLNPELGMSINQAALERFEDVYDKTNSIIKRGFAGSVSPEQRKAIAEVFESYHKALLECQNILKEVAENPRNRSKYTNQLKKLVIRAKYADPLLKTKLKQENQYDALCRLVRECLEKDLRLIKYNEKTIKRSEAVIDALRRFQDEVKWYIPESSSYEAWKLEKLTRDIDDYVLDVITRFPYLQDHATSVGFTKIPVLSEADAIILEDSAVQSQTTPKAISANAAPSGGDDFEKELKKAEEAHKAAQAIEKNCLEFKSWCEKNNVELNSLLDDATAKKSIAVERLHDRIKSLCSLYSDHEYILERLKEVRDVINKYDGTIIECKYLFEAGEDMPKFVKLDANFIEHMLLPEMQATGFKGGHCIDISKVQTSSISEILNIENLPGGAQHLKINANGQIVPKTIWASTKYEDCINAVIEGLANIENIEIKGINILIKTSTTAGQRIKICIQESSSRIKTAHPAYFT